MFQRRSTTSPRQTTKQLPPIQTKIVRPGRSWGKRLVIGLMTVTVIAVALVIGAMVASEALVKPMVAERVERELGSSIQTFVDQELAALPEPVEEPQQYAVSERELNQRIAEQSDLGPLDEASAEINPDGIVVELSAYRMSGTYRAQITEIDGTLRLENGSLSGPLSFAIPVEDLEETANNAILDALVTSNVQITDVTLVDGEIVLTLEPTGAGNDTPSG